MLSLETKAQQPNLFRVGPPQLGSGATLWLAPDFVNFEEKVRIQGRGQFNDFVAPSNRVLLEDVRRRGDRKHPFWANVVCKGIKWSANPE